MIGRKKVLVADDRLDILQSVKTILETAGYEVVVAQDGMQAVRAAHHEKPDIILLDVFMPAGTGISVLERLRMSSATALIPSIVMSAYSLDDIAKKIPSLEKFKDDMPPFIQKPFVGEKLLALVRTALGDGTSNAAAG